jgi:hypothetical protein
MRDRQKIETVLARRFPGSTPGQIAAAANAIMGLDEPSEKLPRGQFSDVDSKGPNGTVAGTGDREGAVGRDMTRGRRS